MVLKFTGLATGCRCARLWLEPTFVQFLFPYNSPYSKAGRSEGDMPHQLLVLIFSLNVRESGLELHTMFTLLLPLCMQMCIFYYATLKFSCQHTSPGCIVCPAIHSIPSCRHYWSFHPSQRDTCPTGPCRAGGNQKVHICTNACTWVPLFPVRVSDWWSKRHSVPIPPPTSLSPEAVIKNCNGTIRCPTCGIGKI